MPMIRDEAGVRLKAIRNHLGLSVRDVEDASRQFAETLGSSKYSISSAWITDVESNGHVPSIFKLYSLSVIYHTTFAELLGMFGIDLGKIGDFQRAFPPKNTIPASMSISSEEPRI